MQIVRVPTFKPETPRTICAELSAALLTRNKCRIWYGDVTTGRAWLEEHGILGYIGISTGTRPIPLLLSRRDSTGGGAILDHCIVRLHVYDESTGWRQAYKHWTFHNPTFEIKPSDLPEYREAVWADGELVARFKHENGAAHYIAFMQGERYRVY